MEFTNNNLNKTVLVKKEWSEKNRKWFEIDVEWKTLWKVSTLIANRLSWKYKEYNCDFWDCWDFVVVKNASKIKVTWKKLDQKQYYRYSWYKWNVRAMSLSELLEKKPENVIWYCVRWMLSKNKLRDRKMKRLKIFAWDSNKYDYLNPEKID